MAATRTCLPLKMPTSKCCNSGTNNNIELKFGEFSYLMDMSMCTNNNIELKFGEVSYLMDIVMCTKNERILRWWVTKLKFLYCFEME